MHLVFYRTNGDPLRYDVSGHSDSVIFGFIREIMPVIAASDGLCIATIEHGTLVMPIARQERNGPRRILR